MDKPINFLGVAERVRNRESHAIDVIGLSNILLLPYLPQSLEPYFALYAVDAEKIKDNKWSASIFFRHTTSANCWGSVKISLATDHEKIDGDDSSSTSLYLPEKYFGHTILAAKCPPTVVTEPGIFQISLEQEGEETIRLGNLQVHHIETPPLSESEIRAIKSYKNAISDVRLALGCKHCDAKLYVQQNLSGELKFIDSNDNNYPVQETEFWKCSCSKTTLPLKYCKTGLHNIFRNPRLRYNINFDSTKLYTDRSINDILLSYFSLINTSPAEEEVQQFLNSNHLFWGFLSPIQIIAKPKILTKFIADFAILSHTRTLYLIEIEKPQTLITKKSGGLSAQMTAGIDQIRDWRVVVEDHRKAFLEELDISSEDVHEVKYILVAGLTKNTDPAGLQAFRRNESSFMHLCFDELGMYVQSVQSAVYIAGDAN